MGQQILFAVEPDSEDGRHDLFSTDCPCSPEIHPTRVWHVDDPGDVQDGCYLNHVGGVMA